MCEFVARTCEGETKAEPIRIRKCISRLVGHRDFASSHIYVNVCQCGQVFMC